MSTPHPKPRHHTLFNVLRPYNGRYLIVCQTTTYKEARCWALHFAKEKGIHEPYPIAPPLGFQKARKMVRLGVCEDCQTEISHLSKSRKCFECEYMDNHPDLEIFREMGI